MPEIYRTQEVLMSQNELYQLVADVENYPKFLPWCNSVLVIEKTPTVIIAELDCDLRGIPIEFTTRNKNTCPESIEISLIKGPFKTLNAIWTFKALGEKKCKVEFRISWQMANFILEKTTGVIFNQLSQKIFDSFVRKAYETRRYD
tara:strand:+ start:716 stop:1153 length:438 start_codon:yes stop_codon:yes gene_type:complete